MTLGYKRIPMVVGLLFATVLLVNPALATAAQAQYIYDDLGRLSQVIDGQGNVATYNYDVVGNLLSITRSTGGVGAPIITSLTLNTGSADASVNVSLADTNLTGAALATGAMTVSGLTPAQRPISTFSMFFVSGPTVPITITAEGGKMGRRSKG